MLKVVGNESAQDETDGRSLLDEITREGARRMLLAALETEVNAYLEAHRDESDGDGHALVVRNGSPKVAEVLPGFYLRGAVHRGPPPGEPNGLAAGTEVTVTADDYAFDPVAGTLAAATADEVAMHARAHGRREPD